MNCVHQASIKYCTTSQSSSALPSGAPGSNGGRIGNLCDNDEKKKRPATSRWRISKVDDDEIWDKVMTHVAGVFVEG
jgi:hypothetical protein